MHTHTVAILQLQEQRVWSELITFPPRKVSWLMSVWPLAKATSDSQAELQGFSFFLHHIPTIVLQETPTQNPTWKQCKCDTVFTFLHFYEALHHKTAQQDSIVRSQQLTSFSVHSMSLLVDISLLSLLLSIIFNATACVAINQITV